MVITSHFDVRSMWDACGDWLSVTDGWLGNSKDLMLMWHCSTNVYLVWLQFHTGRDRSVSVRIWRKTTVFGSVQFGFLKVLWSTVARRCSQSRLVFAKTHTPLHGFVVDLLYNKLYNKSTTSVHLEMLWICCRLLVLQPITACHVNHVDNYVIICVTIILFTMASRVILQLTTSALIEAYHNEPVLWGSKLNASEEDKELTMAVCIVPDYCRQKV